MANPASGWTLSVATRAGGDAERESVLAGVFVLATLCYLAIYVLEGPIRFGLYLVGRDNFILLRDALILGPLAGLFLHQAMRARVHPAFFVAGALLAFHSLVLIGTVGSLTGAIYGVKIMINLLFGFFVASLLMQPSHPVRTALFWLWSIVILGVFLDKAGVPFPWTGLSTTVGDISVDVSRDWQIQDPLSRRVAGFGRSSIAVAAVLPLLAIVLLTQVRGGARVFVTFLSALAVVMTTQKGAVIAFLPIAMLLCLPAKSLNMMRLLCAVFIAMAIAVPLLTMGLHLNHGSGVFSAESLNLRISDTWPDAWDWIRRNSMPGFGVGLGGISGPQRFYAPESFNPADNIFVLMYAYFGGFAFLYIGAIAVLVYRVIGRAPARVLAAISIITFVFGYGIVLSVLEDQAATLFLGAAVGVLCAATGSKSRRVPASLSNRAINPDGGGI